ncbi:MAG: hypothetical protein RL681_106 [Candidatus Parcubacteria bacterium]
MRISFVGGGTDLPDFYRHSPGRVISAAIDKYVYIVLNRTSLVDKVSARYSISETVNHASELQHTRIKAALLDMGIERNIEVASFAPLPAKTGLGSSSSFSVALVKALHAYQGKKISKEDAAEAASRLEIELVGEPIGKQDQYAAAFGGFNVFQFNADGTVDAKPVLIDYKVRSALEEDMLVFFMGLAQDTASTLKGQQANSTQRMQALKATADLVPEFEARLMKGDVKGMGELLHRGWSLKQDSASSVSRALIDEYYKAGIKNGAWGGKVLGVSGSGCMMFLAPAERHPAIMKALTAIAKQNNLSEAREIPVKFVQSGAEVLWNGDHFYETRFA